MLREMKFEVMPICEVGSTFAFSAIISEDDLLDRIKHCRMHDFITISECVSEGVRCISIVSEDGRHIGTYNTSNETLYTSSREVFCQMEER